MVNMLVGAMDALRTIPAPIFVFPLVWLLFTTVLPPCQDLFRYHYQFSFALTIGNQSASVFGVGRPADEAAKVLTGRGEGLTFTAFSISSLSTSRTREKEML